MFEKHRKLFIALIIAFAVPVLVLMCCDITVKKADETPETETVAETIDPLDESALELFDTEKGLTIKMSPEMEEDKSGDLAVYYFADNLMVSVKKVPFEELEEAGTADSKSSIEEYIKIIEENNDGIKFSTDSYGNPSTTYSADSDGVELIYYVTVRKGTDAFWMVNFSGLEEEKDIRIPQFELWGSTIELK